MKAVILASGVGSRLRPFTDENPKTLVRVCGKELLSRIVDTLLEYHITDIVFTTGHLEDMLKKFMAANYPSLSPAYVRNPDYENTNYIYSMWLARDAMAGDDILLFHSDVLFEPHLLGRLLDQKVSGVLVHKTEVSAKDFNARIKDGLITEIDVRLTGDGLRFLAPLYKLRQEDFVSWMEAIGQFVKEGRTKEYAEHAFNEMSPQFPLSPVYFQKNELCMEVDDFDDLQKGAEILRRKAL
ncbi:MAG: NTP transferase domain-containing protein [Parcubacteria group bacterium]|nr:NTP transferase domain-containing protein [Parcubacteria group bacterium]